MALARAAISAASLSIVSVWRDGEIAPPAGDVAPSGARRWLPSRSTLLGSLVVGLIAAGIAAVVMLVDPHHKHHAYASSTLSFSGPSSLQAKRKGISGGRATSSSSAAADRSRRSSVGTSTAGVSHGTGSPATTHDRAGAGVPAAAATAAGGRRLVAEVRDPEEARSYPAPPSVRHSAARTPQAAGEIKVASGAASDAEIRKELAKVQALEEAARQPGKMATVPGGNSIVGNAGTIAIPSGAPEVIQRVIAGANAIADFPYVYGGGHASFVDKAYDCSGSVSYALAAGGLLSAPETSGQLESWGAAGPGRWITVYANAGHTYMYVNLGGAWMLYDTAGRSGVFASRWQPYPVDNSGYVARHWPGL